MNTKTFKEIFISNEYALETLINGNKSECINYLREMMSINSPAGHMYVHEQLLLIFQKLDFHTYEFIKNKVYFKK